MSIARLFIVLSPHEFFFVFLRNVLDFLVKEVFLFTQFIYNRYCVLIKRFKQVR